MAPRAVWSGAITFGLVTIPVGLYSATEDHTIHFHQYVRGTSDRVRVQRVNERSGDVVPNDDIVKGREVDDEIVVVEPDELRDVAPGRSQAIDVVEFVDLAEIDPVYFDRTYWVAPSDDRYTHAYGLLCRALARSNRAGIATVTMHGREHLTALRADGDVLALQTLFWADEVRDPTEQLSSLPVHDEPKQQELDTAIQLVDAMTTTWKPDQYEDTYTARVEQLIADKREGREVVPAEAPAEATDVGGLLEALRRSVEAAGGQARSGDGGGPDGNGDGDGDGDGDGEDLATLSKSELSRRARELDISGRSSMNRDELARAVAQARTSTRAS
ncbi:non-homologous end joining protein Ku [Actinomycetospora lemnae]|uniref:Non-homologous end joining protein Ku n=1 Tax=Actinomycetospora lemnae TaxID=3019891 RepID=A0ABT5STV2_9PSEU|nr:Ku protein [Actinomycetospora sp. DW7H6]MDD7965462.1 Ku protein [Actinomycetospora sp. DW7H6]